jgi:hypothetical protein
MARFFAHLDGPDMDRQRSEFGKISDAKAWAEASTGPADTLHVWQGNWRCAALFRKVAGVWERINE